MNDSLCKQHSGLDSRIKALEGSVSGLWKKWDWIQKTLLGVFITLVFNLICVIAILAKTYIK